METKKLAFLLLVLFGEICHSQIIILNESFTGSFPPAGWIVQTTGTVTWTFNTAGRADTAATSCTNTTSQGIASLVSPALDLTNFGGDSLTFYWRHSSTTIVKEFSVVGSPDNGLTFPDTLYKISLNTSQFSGSSYGKLVLPLTGYDNLSQFRFKFVYNPKGSTSTGQIVRVDDITVTARLHYNCDLNGLSFFPSNPFTTDSLTLQAAIKNTGLKTVLPDSIIFYVDQNSDGNPQHTESLQKLIPTDSIPVNDSTIFTIRYGNLIAGTNRFIVQVFTATDGDTTNDRRTVEITARVPVFDDLGITRFLYLPIQPDTMVTLFITLTNFGFDPASGYWVEFFWDTNDDSIPQPGEMIQSVYGTGIPSGDTLQLPITYTPLRYGWNQFIAQVVFPDDEIPSNDRWLTGFIAYAYRGSVIVHEILYAPIGDEPEWVEIYNSSEDTLNLKDWKISDSNLTYYTITTNTLYFPPGGFAILTANYSSFLTSHPEVTCPVRMPSSWPVLNNTTPDAVVVYDDRSVTMDSVRYSQSWGGNTSGRSLERKEISGLSNDPSNWGSSQRSGGSVPGGGSPGGINSISQKEFDLKCSALSVFPPFPLVGESVMFQTQLKNIGRQPATGFDVAIYRDINGDSLIDPGEILTGYLNQGPLLPGDSLPFSASLDSLEFKSYHLISQITFPGDQDSTNNISFFQFTTGLPPQTVIINEILYSPVTTEKEWIELYNTSNDSIDLNGWKLSDNTLNKKTIANNSIKIAPFSYFVLSENPDSLTQYHPGIPVPVLKPVSWPVLNDNGDDIILYDFREISMDSVAYSTTWGGQNGRSIERKETNRESNDPGNWAGSIDPEKSTPGRKNSVVPKDQDLVLSEIMISPPFPQKNDVVTIAAKIKNLGKATASAFDVSFYQDADRDSLPDPGEMFSQSLSQGPLDPGDSLTISTFLTALEIKTYFLFSRILFPSDQDTSNNTAYARFSSGAIPHTLVINEIQYAPGTGEKEWIELINPSADSIGLNEWTISDNTLVKRVVLTGFKIAPGDFVLLSENPDSLNRYHPGIQVPVIRPSTWPVLNNNGDDMILYDSRGIMIDSVSYSSGWGGSDGKSLERKEPDQPSNDLLNWGSSQDPENSTPGKINSGTRRNYDLSISAPDIFYTLSGAPSSREISLQFVVKNAGKLNIDSYSFSIFLDDDEDQFPQPMERIDTLRLPSVSFPHSVNRYLPGGFPPGIYFFIIKIYHETDEVLTNNVAKFTAILTQQKNDLIVNEIMYSPKSGQPEWVEVQNRSGQAVDLRDWKLGDLSVLSTITGESLSIPDGGFCLLTPDSSIFSFYAIPLAIPVLKVNGFPPLNNDEDEVRLADALGTIIDSVHYFSTWGGETGVSLERINPGLPANDPRNWASSVSPSGSSAGRTNSVYASVLSASASISISANPFSPDADGFEDFTVISYNLPITTAFVRLRIFDVEGRLIRTLMNNEPSGSSNTVVWDGKDNSGRVARIGIYIILLEASGMQQQIVKTVRTTIVVARRL